MKAAIVGCGSIADVHAKCIQNHSGDRLIAFADCKIERAERFAAEYGGKAYASLEEMLDGEAVDVLHVCTPHYLHVRMSVMALERGIHVFQEKPAAVSEVEYQELVSAAARSQAYFGLSYQNRNNGNVIKARELIESGRAGRIQGGRAFVTWKRPAVYYTDSDWRGVLATEGGGCLINQAVHTMDLLSLLLGTPIRVEASMHNHHLKNIIEVEDTVEAYITYRNGDSICHGSFYATTGYCTDRTPLIEIAGTEMTLRLEETELVLYYKNGEREVLDCCPAQVHLGKSYWGAGHQKSIWEFYDCIERGKPYSLNLEQTDTSNRLMFAMYRSAREGREIIL